MEIPGTRSRLDENILNQQALMWTPEGKRKRGRPKIIVNSTILKEGEIIGCKSIQELKVQAAEHNVWRIKTSAPCAACGTKGRNKLNL